MDHARGPERLEAGRHVGADLDRGGHVERTVLLEALVERAALDEPLRHVRMALVLAGRHNRHDVGVLDGLGDPGLPGKAPAERLVTRKVALDELQRDQCPVGAGGGVDLAHPALAE